MAEGCGRGLWPLTKAYFALQAKKSFLCCFGPVATLVSFSSIFSNFERNKKKYIYIKKKQKFKIKKKYIKKNKKPKKIQKISQMVKNKKNIKKKL